MEETKKNVVRGERGPRPPFLVHDFFSSDLKRGRESLSPPKYLVPQQKLTANLPQFAAICHNLPQFVAICHNSQQFAAIRHNLPQLIA
jgi:hypothetical protein